MSVILKILLGGLPITGISHVIGISASSNQLTKVRDQIAKFPALTSVNLGNNQITEIPSVDGKTFIKSRLSSGAEICLGNNQITRVLS